MNTNLKIAVCLGVMMMAATTESFGQRNTFTQYYLNLPSINPAFTGFERFLDFKTGFKQRWSNFDDQNKSFFVSGYGAIGRTSPVAFKNNSLRISNPAIYDRMSANRNLRRMQGIGGMIMFDKVGPFKSLSMNFNYAYHIPLSRTTSLAMGAKVGFIDYKIDFQDYVVRDEVNDQFYQQLINSPEGNQKQFTGDFGLTLYSERTYLGVSSTNLVSKSLGNDDILEISEDKSFELMFGTRFELTPVLELYPGARINYSKIFGASWETNFRLRYDELIYIGALYENDVKAALLFGLTFDRKYNINYSYDYYLNDLREFDTGNHEFTIGLAIFNKYSSEPRLW